jgi:hypothetical protein
MQERTLFCTAPGMSCSRIVEKPVEKRMKTRWKSQLEIQRITHVRA